MFKFKHLSKKVEYSGEDKVNFNFFPSYLLVLIGYKLVTFPI
jgi:hypothetical protein